LFSKKLRALRGVITTRDLGVSSQFSLIREPWHTPPAGTKFNVAASSEVNETATDTASTSGINGFADAPSSAMDATPSAQLHGTEDRVSAATGSRPIPVAPRSSVIDVPASATLHPRLPSPANPSPTSGSVKSAGRSAGDAANGSNGLGRSPSTQISFAQSVSKYAPHDFANRRHKALGLGSLIGSPSLATLADSVDDGSADRALHGWKRRPLASPASAVPSGDDAAAQLPGVRSDQFRLQLSQSPRAAVIVSSLRSTVETLSESHNEQVAAGDTTDGSAVSLDSDVDDGASAEAVSRTPLLQPSSLEARHANDRAHQGATGDSSADSMDVERAGTTRVLGFTESGAAAAAASVQHAPAATVPLLHVALLESLHTSPRAAAVEPVPSTAVQRLHSPVSSLTRSLQQQQRQQQNQVDTDRLVSSAASWTEAPAFTVSSSSSAAAPPDQYAGPPDTSSTPVRAHAVPTTAQPLFSPDTGATVVDKPYWRAVLRFRQVAGAPTPTQKLQIILDTSNGT